MPSNYDKTINQFISYLDGELSAAEAAALRERFNHSAASREIWEEITNLELLAADLHQMQAIDERYYQQALTRILRRKKRRRWSYGIAASLLIAGLAGWWLSGARRSDKADSYVQVRPDKMPDSAEVSSRSYLLLADGTRLMLDEQRNGIISHYQGGEIIKSDSVIYFRAAVSRYQENNGSYPTIEAGKAEPPYGKSLYHRLFATANSAYRLVLPDSSSIRLNAASSVDFPIHFSMSHRHVAIRGEGYFDITHQEQGHFTVRILTSAQDASEEEYGQVQVLGTRFNIRAYRGEAVQTTLLTGKLEIYSRNAHLGLSAGERAIIDKPGQLHRSIVDEPDQSIDWTKGFFSFDNTDLFTILREVERWYSIKVVFKGKVPADKLMLYAPRSSSLAEILNTLQASAAIRYTIHNHIVTIEPK